MLQASRRIDAWNPDSERAVEMLQELSEIEFNLGDRIAAAARIEAADERTARSSRVGSPRAGEDRCHARPAAARCRKYDAAARLLPRLIDGLRRSPRCEDRRVSDLRRHLVLASVRTGRIDAAVTTSLQAPARGRRCVRPDMPSTPS
jgi:hypothetical protein